MTEKKFNPDFAIHPGSTLMDTLDSLSMSQVELAERTGLTPKHINEIIKEKSAITPETAIKLASVFGMSPTFWNNLQKKYEETTAALEAKKSLEKETTLLSKFSCYVELVKWGYVESANSSTEKVLNLHKFFGVSSLGFVSTVQSVAFRKAKKDNLNRESLAAWLRCGEIDAKKIEVKEFNKDLVKSSIEGLRALTRQNPKVFSKSLVDICACMGIAVVLVPYFKNTHVCGAARWINDKPIIQLSLRGSYSDIFWFTFFHELGHILKHGKKNKFVDLEKKYDGLNKEKEKEADDFATNTLIPDEEFNEFKSEGDFTPSGIKSFAKKVNIDLAIVAGRLSHDYEDWITWAALRSRLTFVSKN